LCWKLPGGLGSGGEAEVAKLAFLRGLGAHVLDLSALPAERRRYLAMVGRRLTSQALERREPQRRVPVHGVLCVIT
jgi:hypothetical protein